MTETMLGPSLYELEKPIREAFPEMRVHDWRSVESMREQVARYGLGASRAGSQEMAMKRAASALDGVIEALRAEKRYDLSDKLRAIKESLSLHG
jgi:hypothetical protein